MDLISEEAMEVDLPAAVWAARELEKVYMPRMLRYIEQGAIKRSEVTTAPPSGPVLSTSRAPRAADDNPLLEQVRNAVTGLYDVAVADVAGKLETSMRNPLLARYIGRALASMGWKIYRSPRGSSPDGKRPERWRMGGGAGGGPAK